MRESYISDHKNETILHSFSTAERCPTAVRNWLHRTKVQRDIIEEYRGIRKLQSVLKSCSLQPDFCVNSEPFTGYIWFAASFNCYKTRSSLYEDKKSKTRKTRVETMIDILISKLSEVFS